MLLDDSAELFHPSEVELGETVQTIFDQVKTVDPARVVFDSLSELRLLAGTSLRYRRQMMTLKRFFSGRQCTVLLLDDRSATDQELQLQSIADGVVKLEQLHPEYGAERRRLKVVKYRAKTYRGGYHDFAIRRGGLDVFERLVAAEHELSNGPSSRVLSTGIAAIDSLLGGGIASASSTLVSGPSGCGKSSLAAQIVVSAAEQGVPGAMFVFDESPHLLLMRASGMGIDLAKHVESGLVSLRSVDPAELSSTVRGASFPSLSTTSLHAVVCVRSLSSSWPYEVGPCYCCRDRLRTRTPFGPGIRSIASGVTIGW